MAILRVMLALSVGVCTVISQVPIPSTPLGFVYKNASHSAPIHIDAYLDLACPDSKNAFPVMQQVADTYTDKNVRVKFFIFPLPYHRNAHLAAIGTQAVYSQSIHGLSPDDSAISWAAELFSTQSSWSDYSTREMNISQIKSLLASYAATLGFDATQFQKDLGNSEYDWNARVEWKFGCSRGVAGTPWFFINGVNVAADGSWKFANWKKVIDALLQGRTVLSSF